MQDDRYTPRPVGKDRVDAAIATAPEGMRERLARMLERFQVFEQYMGEDVTTMAYAKVQALFVAEGMDSGELLDAILWGIRAASEKEFRDATEERSLPGVRVLV